MDIWLLCSHSSDLIYCSGEKNGSPTRVSNVPRAAAVGKSVGPSRWAGQPGRSVWRRGGTGAPPGVPWPVHQHGEGAPCCIAGWGISRAGKRGSAKPFPTWCPADFLDFNSEALGQHIWEASGWQKPIFWQRCSICQNPDMPAFAS